MEILALCLLVVAMIVTTGSTVVMLLTLRGMTPKVPLRLRVRLWGLTGACWALLLWSRHAYAFLLLVISAGLLVGTMVLALMQIRRSRRI